MVRLSVVADLGFEPPAVIGVVADSFGFLQPLASTGNDLTFSFSVSNITYTGDTDAGSWQADDLVVADFDGDGNVDRLYTMSAQGTALNESWTIDTKNGLENWRVTRGDGAPPVRTLPAQHVVGDFNGDGRDDILARNDTGPWSHRAFQRLTLGY